MPMVFVYAVGLIQLAFIGYVVFLIARIDRNLTIQSELLSKIGKLLERNGNAD
jgi:hypothetical protein